MICISFFYSLYNSNNLSNTQPQVKHHCSLQYHLQFQTDNLEFRFSEYRQLAGRHYNISVWQLFECEKKIRKLSVLNMALSFHEKSLRLKNFEEISWEIMDGLEREEIDNSDITVTANDIEGCNGVLPVIVYLAGYCCYTVNIK